MIKSEYLKMYLLEDTHFWFVGKRFFIKTYLDKIKSRISNILDIGSGTGGATKLLDEYGEVVGVEKNPYARFLARKRGLKIIKGKAEKLPFKNNSFNLVTVFDVLYHKDIKSVGNVLKEIFRVLKPKGQVLITDSALSWLNSQHDQFMFSKRRFSLAEINDLLISQGFSIIKSSYIYFFIFPLVFIKRKIIDSFHNNDHSDVFKIPFIINWVLIFILRLEAILLSLIYLPIGSSIIILAQKNEQK